MKSIKALVGTLDVAEKSWLESQYDLEDRELRSKSEEAIKRLAQLSSLSRIATTVTSSSGVDELLRSALREIRQSLDFSSGSVWLFDEQKKELYIAASEGLAAELGSLRIPSDSTIIGWVAEKGQPVYIPDATRDTGDPKFKPLVLKGCRHLSRICAPLKMRDEMLGTIVLTGDKPNTFTDADLSFLSTLADQVAIVISNANMYKQIERLAVLEERYHIAREIHDGVAQTLSYLTVDSELIDSLLDKGDVTRARCELARMRRALKATHAEMREFMENLRTKVSDSAGLLPAIEQAIHEFEEQSGIQTEFVTTDGKLRLTSLSESYLLRIVQEGLANARKHSQASHVRVRLQVRAGEVELAIEDNGCGFDIAQFHRGDGHHLGLTIMSERAKRLGGYLEVMAKPGAGTKVVARIPNLERRR